MQRVDAAETGGLPEWDLADLYPGFASHWIDTSAGKIFARAGGSGPPLMLLFGTGFGLAPPVLERADLVLAPILGPGAYNHLSVRSAAGIILDRLRGK